MAESANTGRSNSFVLEELTEFQREKLKNGESVKFNFSKDVKKENKVIEGGHPQGFCCKVLNLLSNKVE
ncbi:hypothetical protein V2U43_09895 [Streptococcus agalactiae]